MSIQFERPITEGQQDMVRKLLKTDLVDDKTALFDAMTVHQQDMKKLANETKQVVSVELNSPGDIKTMSDGTQYKATPQGWVKIPI